MAHNAASGTACACKVTSNQQKAHAGKGRTQVLAGQLTVDPVDAGKAADAKEAACLQHVVRSQPCSSTGLTSRTWHYMHIPCLHMQPSIELSLECAKDRQQIVCRT